MAYMVTFHGVTPATLDAFRSRLQTFQFGAESTEGLACNPDAEVAFKYVEDASQLIVSIRRKPLLMSHGQIYSMIADALIDLGAEFKDALLS
jgi:hypothetical protein